MDKTKSRTTGLFGQLYFQVFLGFLLGIAVGYCWPGFGESLKPLGDGFIKLIKMLLAPIIFGTVVVGIAKMGNLKEVGRVGIKALVYFEIVSTLALAIGLVVVNVMKPGVGMNIEASTLDGSSLATYTTAARQQDAAGFFMDIIPSSFADAFVKGNMLQIILISVLFGLALAQLPDRGKVIVEVIDSVLQGLFGIVRFVMYLAPLAAFGRHGLHHREIWHRHPGRLRQVDWRRLSHERDFYLPGPRRRRPDEPRLALEISQVLQGRNHGHLRHGFDRKPCCRG